MTDLNLPARQLKKLTARQLRKSPTVVLSGAELDHANPPPPSLSLPLSLCCLSLALSLAGSVSRSVSLSPTLSDCTAADSLLNTAHNLCCTGQPIGRGTRTRDKDSPCRSVHGGWCSLEMADVRICYWGRYRPNLTVSLVRMTEMEAPGMDSENG